MWTLGRTEVEYRMKDKEFDLCNKKCKSFLKRNKYGKLVSKELNSCFQMIFREGYKLGSSTASNKSEDGK